MPNLIATNATSFLQLLQDVGDGQTIQLGAGTFNSEPQNKFTLNKNNVTVIGLNAETILNSSLEIIGDGNKIQDMTFDGEEIENIGIELKGNNNVLDKLEISNFKQCVQIDGNENIIKDVKLKNATTGLDLKGHKNKIRIPNITIENTKIGLIIFGNENFVEDLELKNVFRGIILEEGNNTEINMCSYIVEEGQENRDEIISGVGRIGISLRKGEGSTISGFTCNGIRSLPPQFEFGVHVLSEALNGLNIENSKVGSLYLEQMHEECVNLSVGADNL